MQVRHILGLAIFCGVVGTLGGPSVQAQPNNSIGFVQLLLLRESRQIAVDEKAIASQDNNNRLLSLLEALSPTTGRQARQINREIAQLQVRNTFLQAQIDNTTSLLLGLKTALGSMPLTSPYDQFAAQNALIIKSLASRGPFGVPPASIFQ